MKIKLIVFICIVGVQHLVFSQTPQFPDAKPIFRPRFLGITRVETRNINHPKGVDHQDVKRGTLVLVTPRKDYDLLPCSATLMNTVPNLVSQDYYILTAAHCLENHKTNEPFYFSFNYELASATKKHEPPKSYAKDVPTFEPFRGGVEIVFVDKSSDIGLVKVNSDNLSESEQLQLKHAYAVGYDLHPLNVNQHFSLVSHPNSDYRKLYTNPASLKAIYKSLYYNKILQPEGRKIYIFGGDWDDTKSTPQLGSSGSGLLHKDGGQSGFGVAGVQYAIGVNSNEKPYPPRQKEKFETYFSLLENVWNTPLIRLQNFLDPEKTWISKIPGGYFNEAISNPPDVDYDLHFSEQGQYKSDLKLNLLDYIIDPDIGKIKENHLGNGIIFKEYYNNEIYMTITPKGDPNFLLYGIYHDQSSNKGLDYFEGKGWKTRYPPIDDLPKITSILYPQLEFIYDLVNFRPRSSKDMRLNVQNYMFQAMKKRSLDLNSIDRWTQFTKEEPTLDIEVILRTNDKSEKRAEVRAIKFPYSMPYNAVELFDSVRFAELWTFRGYPDSRGLNSNNLHINSVGIDGEYPVISGNNGGYLNMVNELVPLGPIEASTIDNISSFQLTIKVQNNLTRDSRIYHKIWVDWIPDVDDNKEYFFTENKDDLADPNNPIELISEGESTEETFTINYSIPTATQLSLASGQEGYYQLRIAVSDRINGDMSPDGFYENGEVEDYLLHVIAPASSARESTTANGSPKTAQDGLPNLVVLETAPLGDVEAKSVSKEAIAVVVLPNPASEAVNVLFDSEISGTATIGLYTLAGVELINKEIVATAGSNTHKLNTAKLVKGTYIVKVSGAGVDSSSLLAIERN